MKPISKCISYGYNKSVQLFVEEDSAVRLGVKKEGLVSESQVYILLISERDIHGELQNMAEYRYTDYAKVLLHLHNLVINFIYGDLCQQ